MVSVLRLCLESEIGRILSVSHMVGIRQAELDRSAVDARAFAVSSGEA